MANVIPVKALFVGSNVVALGELESGDTIDKAIVGLGNVDNTSDANKPVSTLQATSIATKAALAGSTAQAFSVSNLTFPATQVASASPNTLDDYEEGTWTPVDSSGAGLTLTSEATATYTKIGRQVTVSFAIKLPTTSNTNQVTIGGFPFAAVASYFGLSIAQSEYATPITGGVSPSGSAVSIFTFGNSAVLNSNFSGLRLRGSLTYFTS
jgi:hypothetical protein